MLHRLTCYVYNPSTNRIEKECTPWHPNKEHIDRVCENYYKGVAVKFESVNFYGADNLEDTLPDYLSPEPRIPTQGTKQSSIKFIKPDTDSYPNVLISLNNVFNEKRNIKDDRQKVVDDVSEADISKLLNTLSF